MISSLVAFSALVAIVSASGFSGYSPNNQVSYSGNYNHGPHIPILRYDNVNNGDGTYHYSYETGNGISARESGVGAKNAEGAFSYRAPDGQQISLTYTADENGFRPHGSHLPTPPPIPDAILKSIEFNRQHPSNDDGAYNHGRYQNSNGGYHY